MTKARLKEKLADQKRICEAMSETVQHYHGRVDELYGQIMKIKARGFDLLSERYDEGR